MTMRLRTTSTLIALGFALSSCTPTEPTSTSSPNVSRPVGLNSSIADMLANSPPGGTTSAGVAYASIDLSCGGKTYTIKTGTDGGRCDVTTYPSNPKANHAICSDGSKGAGGANCTEGCVSSEGAGSCSVKTTH